MPTYPGTGIIAPTDGYLSDAAPRGTVTLISDLVDRAIVIRPIRKADVNMAAYGMVKRCYTCDVYDLVGEEQLHVDVWNPKMFPYLDAAMREEGVVAGTVREDATVLPVSRFLEPLRDADTISHAARVVKELGWDTPTDYSARVGSRIGEVRRSLGFTQSSLAEFLELSPSGVSDLESGKRTVTVDVMERAANFLGVPVTALF